jgi:hypothetical protein
MNHVRKHHRTRLVPTWTNGYLTHHHVKDEGVKRVTYCENLVAPFYQFPPMFCHNAWAGPLLLDHGHNRAVWAWIHIGVVSINKHRTPFNIIEKLVV